MLPPHVMGMEPAQMMEIVNVTTVFTQLIAQFSAMLPKTAVVKESVDQMELAIVSLPSTEKIA